MLSNHSSIRSIRRHLPPILEMALPIMVGQVGQMVMILIDMFMVGRLGPQAIGGAGLGNAIFYVFTLFGMGTLYALDFLVSNAQGAGDEAQCRYWLRTGLYLSVILSVPLVVALLWIARHLAIFHFAPALTTSASAFLVTLSPSLFPFLVFVAYRQYLQATGSPRPGTVITLLAIASNVVFDVVLIFGVPGWLPALGVAGAGLATTLTRTLMAVSLAWYTIRRDRRALSRSVPTSASPSPPPSILSGLVRLFKIGGPAGVHVTLEASVFSVATAMLSHLGVVPAAAHTIVLNITSFTYMAPLGLSGAAAVVVGSHLGARRRKEACACGYVSLALSAVIMACSGLVLVLASRPIVSIFTADPVVVALAQRLLYLVAIYQVADGLQVVGAGALRGLGDTRSPVVAILVGYWVVGLPVGFWLGFGRGLGAFGLWVGLTIGLFVVAAYILWRWREQSIICQSDIPELPCAPQEDGCEPLPRTAGVPSTTA